MPEFREFEAEFERHEAEEPPEFRGKRLLQRLGVALAALAVIGSLLLLPPLLNVNRYRRQIATSISASLGRPVHLDAVTLNLLPTPGFTLSNFVVSEDADFGGEPVIRANSVRASLRMRSLWHRRVEFSRIALKDPSVNIVHLSDGRWNLESILLQASRMPASPTSQVSAGGAQRFPYIEATGARLNLKQNGEKTPFSLTDANFALWLPEPERWQLRLEGHPTRTDTAVSDTGTVRLEGTLGHAALLSTVPVELRADWAVVPLGSVSEIVSGHDAGLRGQMSLTATLKGPLGDTHLDSRLQLNGLRRADFVPVQAVDLTIACSAHAVNILSTLSEVECSSPLKGRSTEETLIRLSGSIPDVRHPSTSAGTLTVAHLPAAALLDAWRVVSSRVPNGVTVAGEANGSLTYGAGGMNGTFTLDNAVLGRDGRPIAEADIKLRLDDQQILLGPVPVDLGGSRPLSIGGRFSWTESELDLSGGGQSSRLLELGAAVPQLGDGLNDIIPPGSSVFSLNARALRPWGTNQMWTLVSSTPVRTRSKPVRRHGVTGR